jgi:hypothetical protein
MPEIMTQTVHADPVIATPSSRTGRQREDRDGISQEVLGKAGANAQTSPEGPAAAKRARKTLQDRLQEVIEQQQQLTAQKRVLAAQQRAEARARAAQLDSMIGAACRADKSTHAAVKAALDKQVLDPKQRAFLRAEGWLVASVPARAKGAENE